MIPESANILTQLLLISSRLDEQAFEITLLRNALDLQSKRIVHLQAELDVLPAGRKRREARRPVPLSPAPPHNGNGSSGR